MNNPALRLESLTVDYGTFRAVDGVSLEIAPGETVGLVGESGCGKTTVARAILGLQPYTGSIRINGQPVRGVARDQASRLGMIWQDPYASLNPLWRVGRSIQEPAVLCGQTIDLARVMHQVGLAPEMAERYPHELSGGQRQRVAIARAMALRPSLVLCDEPTAALDLSVQAQVLNLLKDVQQEVQCAYLYISHDLATVRYLADRIAVMYFGKIVELGPAEQVFSNPAHEYTRLLLDSMLSHERVGQLP